MIFAANHVRDFHFDVVDHVHDMKNPRAVRVTDGHVRMRAWIGEIEIDFPANQIADDDVLAWRAKTQRALVFENMTAILKVFQVALVNVGALALKIRTEISADMRSFVPINTEPLESLVNRGRGFFGVAFDVRVFDSQHQFAAGVTRKQPVEQRGARTADMEVTGRRRSKANADVN